MRKVLAIAIGVALAATTAHAQPRQPQQPQQPQPAPPQPAPRPPVSQPRPAPTPAPAAPAKPTPLRPDQEKATPNAALPATAPAEGTYEKIEEVSEQRQEAATRAFQEGNSFLNDGIFPKAVDRYTEALKHWDHPAIHYNMALALMYLDRPIEQYESLQKSIRYGPDPLEKDKYDHAREYMVLVEKQLATVEVSCQKEGARVSINGKQVFVVEKGKPNVWRGRVRIGRHTFVAEKPGYATPVDAPFIGPGETFRIELKLYTAEELTRFKRRWETKIWAPWVVLGGGALLGVAGGALQWSARESYQQFDSEVARCNQEAGNIGCDTKATGIADLRDSGDTKRLLGVIGYSVAGAAIVTGSLLAYLNRRVAYQITTDEYRLEELRKQRAQPGAVTVAPFVAPGAGGALVMGRF
jgi:tetratricopeptide (TPR) repeat protein